MSALNVMVLWAGPTSSNLGVRVLAEGAQTVARQAFGAETSVAFRDFVDTEDGLGFNRRTIIQDMRGDRVVADALKGIDIVIDTGAGDSFADIYGIKRAVLMEHVRRRVRQANIPYVLGPQTIGPFRTFFGRSLAKRTLRQAVSTYARDPQSVLAAKAIADTAARLSTDLVFALPQENPVQRRDILLNVSGLLLNRNPHVDSEWYKDQIVALTRTLLEEGRKVSALVHVLDSGNVDSDHSAAIWLAREFDGIEVVVPNSLQDVRGAIAGSNLVIGSRMHACLNALSQGVPAVPLAYSRKFGPLMNHVGWSTSVDLTKREDVVAPTMSAVGDLEAATRAARDLSVRQRDFIQHLVEDLRETGKGLKREED